MLLAWLSATSDSFNCKNCKRKNFVCPMLDHKKPIDLEERIKKANLPSAMPLIFKYESIGVCPRIAITPFSQLVAKAYQWWEKGQLGINYTEAPIWVDQAFTIYANNLGRARQFVSKQRQSDRGK